MNTKNAIDTLEERIEKTREKTTDIQTRALLAEMTYMIMEARKVLRDGFDLEADDRLHIVGLQLNQLEQ